MRITVLYFAALRDCAGKSEEQMDLPAGVRTVGELAEFLPSVTPGVQGKLAGVRFALNEQFAEDESPLADCDTVALIPPVSGG